MTLDLYKEVLFNDGEGIVHTDLNDDQRFANARLWDQIIHGQIGSIDIGSASRDPEFGGQDGYNHPTSRCYCLNPGSAYLRQGSANNKIQVAPGTLLQKTTSITGNAPSILSYTFNGVEEWTLTNGDATNPRVDLLQMTLTTINSDSQNRDFEDAATRIVTTTSVSKKRGTNCVLSVKTGTPSASPTIPEPDAGAVVVGTVMVGNGWTTVGTAPVFGEDSTALNNLVVHDQRMPLRVRSFWTDPITYKLAAGWTLSSNNSSVTSTNPVNDMYVSCPVGIGRLVGIGVCHTTTPIGGQALGRSNSIISTSWVSRISVAQLSVGGMDVTPYFTFEATQAPNLGPTIIQSGSSKIGVPIWTNGRRCPHEAVRTSTPGTVPCDRLVFRIQSGVSGSIVGQIVFFVAEGL